jgi:hypothetical protein
MLPVVEMAGIRAPAALTDTAGMVASAPAHIRAPISRFPFLLFTISPFV